MLNPTASTSREIIITPKSSSVRVIDGDTIELESMKIRLFGIDAPEIGQPCLRNNEEYDCGTASKQHLEYLLSGSTVSCDNRGTDKWGRKISVCMADKDDINQMMVKHGWAIAYRQYSSIYIKDEDFARSNRLGMWSREFSVPSKWRKSKGGKKQ